MPAAYEGDEYAGRALKMLSSQLSAAVTAPQPLAGALSEMERGAMPQLRRRPEMRAGAGRRLSLP